MTKIDLITKLRTMPICGFIADRAKLLPLLALMAAVSACQTSDPDRTAKREAERFEFCKSVIDVTAENDKYCGDLRSRLLTEKAAQDAADTKKEEEEQAFATILPDKCKTYIGDIMGRSPSSMNTDYTASNPPIAGISYIRPDDNTRFKYECTIQDGNIVWRGVDIYEPGGGPGRWRDEDAKPLSSI